VWKRWAAGGASTGAAGGAVAAAAVAVAGGAWLPVAVCGVGVALLGGAVGVGVGAAFGRVKLWTISRLPMGWQIAMLRAADALGW
jgi:uncharacterized membrane protein